ncbi:hypothetical protein JMG10_04310 [Nostoc ellipsosporum NOK]|nr:hypothetical protein [Nostoc ellipsosporum NOK]
MMRTFTLIALLLFAGSLQAQLFKQKLFYPNTSTVTRKSLNGTGGKGFWTLEHLDNLGRPVARDYYRNKKLLQQDIYKYNGMNDLVEEVIAFDINDPKRKDTTRYEYVYDKGLITWQKQINGNKDSTIIQLVEKNGDSVLRYSSIAYHYAPDKKTTIQVEKRIVATFNKNRLVQLFTESMNKELGDVLVVYEYDENGLLQHRMTRGNTPEVVRLGSPGSPVAQYTYEYDEWGRLISYYSIVNDESILLASYEYK